MSLKAKLFRGLGDSTRLSILECLCVGEKSNSQIVEETGQLNLRLLKQRKVDNAESAAKSE
jgi:hypothetical protein